LVAELYEALEVIILGITQGNVGPAAIKAAVDVLARARGDQVKP
jgi:hypothetical protein